MPPTLLLVVLWLALAVAVDGARQPGRFQFGQASYSTSADFGVAVVAVQRHLGADGRAAVFVSSKLSDGSAVAGRDYVALFNQSLQWLDGEDLDKELYVKVLNAGRPQEISKQFTLFLHDANGATLNPDRSQTQIVLVPPANLVSGSFRLLETTMIASESATDVLEVPVVWEGGTTATARLAYTVSTVSASISDFEVLSPSILSWTRGQNTTQLIRIQIPDDGVFEQAETLRVKLLPPKDLDPTDAELAFGLTPATLGNISETIVTIKGPNNVKTGVVQFEAPCFPACASIDYTVKDGGLVRAHVQRRNGSDGFVQARFISVEGSAKAGIDFKPVDTIIRWEHGSADPQYVLVETIGGVVRRNSVQFQLQLVDLQALGDIAPSDVASFTTIKIEGPSNIYASDVDFVRPNSLTNVLRRPDVPFLPLVTRLDSGIRMCPRIVISTPGVVTLHLQRFFGTRQGSPASVVVKSIDGTAVAGVDYAPLAADGVKIDWRGTDADTPVKTVEVGVLEPPGYYTGRRSFFVEIASVDGVALGLCHSVEIVLDRVSRVPRVIAFDLDMDTGVLSLRTTNPVLAGTLDATAITLQNAALAPNEAFALSPQSGTASPDGVAVAITLSIADLNTLKRFNRLAKTASATYLSMHAGAFDFALENCLSNGLAACAHAPFDGISPSAAIAVTTFTHDTTSPRLLSFSLELGQRLLKLRFSEPVDWTTARIDNLGFSDTATAIDMRWLSTTSSQLFRPTPNPLSGVLLNDGNPLPPDATYVVLQLGVEDLSSLRSVGNGQIGLQAASTFITVTSDFISDFSGNKLVAIEQPATLLMRVATADCSACPANTFLASSCSDMRDRVCSPCTVCPTNSYALTSCTPLQDTVCYPCTECFGAQYASVACTPTTNRVCLSCTRCTSDEYESSPCVNGVDRVCRTCDSCALSKEQQQLCNGSKKWKRRQMKAPTGCPLSDQQYQTLEARLQRAKSNRCGAGRCSCTGNLVGNFNPNGDSFPDDPRCSGPEVYGIDL